MSRDASLLRELKAAMRQAAHSLEGLKLLKPDQDPRIERLLRELRSVSPEETTQEAMSGD